MADTERAMNYIDGQWCWPDGAGEIKSINPADTREVVCVAPDTPDSEVDRAVQAAKKALPAWKRTPPPARATIIRKAGQIMAERKQQMGEGWFASLKDVPSHAISMGIKQILKSKNIIVTVPDERKARAVKDTLEGEISNMSPASILRTHSNCMLFLDKAAASLLV